MDKRRKPRVYLSAIMAAAVLAGSFNLTGFAQMPDNADRQASVYRGSLICGLEEHSHSEECYEKASASDAKKEETVCGLEEHLHDAGCYEAKEAVTEEPAAEKPGTESLNPSDTVQAEAAESMEDEDEELAEQEEELFVETYAEAGGWNPQRDPVEIVQVRTFEELKDAVDAVNNESSGRRYYCIDVQNEIDWTNYLTVGEETAILIQLNGFTINMTTGMNVGAKKSQLCIQGPGTINVTSESTQDGRSLFAVEREYSSNGNAGELTINDVKITAEGEARHPIFIRNSGNCYLNNIEVQDYSVHGSFISLYHITDYATALLEINRSAFNGVNSDADGGVLCVGENKGTNRANRAEINNSTFIDNHAKNGGAIYAGASYGTVIINEGTFCGNTAEEDGGALAVDGGTVTLDGTNFVFEENKAGGNGGAICQESGWLLEAGGRFSGNHARNGGALYFSGTLGLKDAEFTRNTAEGNGGAVYSRGNMTIDGLSFTGNSAFPSEDDENGLIGNGGAVYVEKELTINNSDFSENTAAMNGGAVYAEDALTIHDIVCDGNSASENGGAVYAKGALTVLGGSFMKNTAGGWGGAIFVTDAAAVFNPEKQITISENAAQYTGGIEIWGKEATFYDLVATENIGPGECISGAKVTMENDRSPAIFDNLCIGKDSETVAADDFFTEMGATVCGTMLGEGSANWYYSGYDVESSSYCTVGPINKESGTIEISAGDKYWHSEPSEQDKENALAVAPCVLVTKNRSEKQTSAIDAFTLVFITNERIPDAGDQPEEPSTEETKPEETTPEETKPEETTPEETKPEESKPEETLPEESTPEESSPAESTPPESVPEESSPAETVPVHSGGGSGERKTEPRNSVETAAENLARQEMQITSPSYIGTGSWQANFTGTSWKLQKPDGTYAASEWGYVDGSWYLFGADGYTCTGWQKVNGEWYYFQPNAVMKKDWIILEDKWYYLDESGAMKKGWVFLNGKWYFLGEDGAMFANTTTPDGYVVDENGEWKP